MSNQPPKKTFRIGRVQASIFEHSKDEYTWYSTSYTRSYRDEKGKTQFTEFFNEEDNPVIEKLAAKVTLYISEQRDKQ